MGQGRNVMVTGGNQHRAGVSRAFAEGGDNVVGTHRSGEPPEGLQGCAKTSPTRPPSTRPSPRPKSLLGGPIEVLIANAGITKDRPAHAHERRGVRPVIDTNLTGAFRCARRASKGMIRLRKAESCHLQRCRPLRPSGQTNYAASKSALVGLSWSISREPGRTRHHRERRRPGLHRDRHDGGLPEDRKKAYQASIPAGRFAQPEEVAAGSFIASDDAAYITGAVILVDGGLGMGHRPPRSRPTDTASPTRTSRQTGRDGHAA